MDARGPHRARTRWRASATALVSLLAACFTYTPIEPGAVAPGMSVRARVSAAAGERIAPLLGATDARLLTGTLISHASDTLVVEVPTVAAADPVAFGQLLHQRVSIPRGDLRELEARRIDRVRTVALAGGAAVIVATMLVKILHGEPGSEPLPPGPGTDNLVPLLRLRIQP